MSARPLVAVVDDDESLRDATCNFLEAAGFSVAAFADAESFLRAAGGPGAACLVADMRMPGMSGLQLHEHLAASGAPIPTILITAYASDGMRFRARKAGIVCCLAKPFVPDELLECVRRAVAGVTPKS
jgi:FixJ family two-component response regulator